jgi:hypothetical protein
MKKHTTMNIKKLTIFLIFALVGHFQVNAQLSKRVNDTSTFHIGTRPQSGNFAFFLSTSYQEIEDMADRNIEVTGIPVINLKYYFTDEIVFGLGIQSYSSKEFLSGKLAEDQVGTTNDISSESRYLFSPRAEYHFAESNILDAYGGVAVPIGWEKDRVEIGQKYNIAGDYTSEVIEKSSMLYGFNLFVGVQAFIADLPMAIGLEAGIRGFRYADLTYKHDENYSINGEEFSQTYYTSGNERGVTYTEYEELEYNEFEMGSDLRITFNYFFSR